MMLRQRGMQLRVIDIRVTLRAVRLSIIARFKLTGIPSGLIFALKSSNCSGKMPNNSAASRVLPPCALFNKDIVPLHVKGYFSEKSLRNQGKHHILCE